MTPHPVVLEYYACFNERRFADGLKLFAPDAVIEHPALGPGGHGRDRYLELVNLSVQAFPDGHVTVEHAERRGDSIYEVDYVATGTHAGDFEMRGFGAFKATGNKAVLKFREVFEIRDDKIVYLSLRLDTHEFLRQLGRQSP
jgi:ketosteroid isomerase-like protein